MGIRGKKIAFLYIAAHIFTGTLGLAWERLPAGCEYDKECLIEQRGLQCADGTPSYFTLTARKNAKQLLVYLSGGGACWDRKSCEAGYAQSLTRKVALSDWNNGKGIRDASDAGNPFRANFDIVGIPYCTADVFTGRRKVDYGTTGNPYVINHRGYDNVREIMARVKTEVSAPEKVVLLGCSAGGIGALYHLRTVAENFPEAKKYVVSDAGTPFKPPYVPLANYRKIMESWGADQTMPGEYNGKKVEDFGAVVKFNREAFPQVSFGFISSYRDVVMTFFAFATGAVSPKTVIKQLIVDVADNDIGRNADRQKVFYTDASRHCHTGEPLASMTSLDTDLGEWLTAMVRDEKGWDNVRPDLIREIEGEAPLYNLEQLKHYPNGQ